MEKMSKKFLVGLFAFCALLAPVNADDEEDAAIFYNEAIDLYSQDEVDKSVELFKKAIELNPDFYEAHYNLAQILMSQDKNEEAYPILLNILKLKPNDTETLYNIGKTQYKRGYLTSSYEFLKQIPQSAPQYSSAEILISKIEKRQDELALEKKIATRQISLNENSIALPVALVEIKAPSGIVSDSMGNIYTASFSDNVIYKTSTSGKKTVFSKSTLIKGPVGLAIDKTGNIYAANYSGNTIIKILPDGKSEIFANIQKPYCIFFDEIHNRLYATEQNSNKLVKFDI